MKKIVILPLFFLLITQFFWAQKSLVGSYQISSTNPYDVVSHWLLFDNSEFAVIRSNTVIAGKYKQVDEEIDFIPAVPKEPFHVFGRFNSEITGTRIMFKGVNLKENIYVATSSDVLYSVLKKKAKCIPFPLAKTFEKPIENLILANYVGNDEVDNKFSSDYNIGNFNDFIILYFNSETILPPFKGKISHNKLRVEYGLSSYENLIISDSDEMQVEMSVEKLQNYYNQDSIISDNEYNFVTFSPDLDTDIERRILNNGDYDFDSSNEVFTVKNLEISEEKFPTDFERLFVYKIVDSKPISTPGKLSKRSLFDYQCH